MTLSIIPSSARGGEGANAGGGGRALGRPRLGLALACLGILGTTGGCEQDARSVGEAAQDVRGAVIVVIGPSETDPQWPGIRGGAQRYAARLPILRVHCPAPPDTTPAALLATVEQALELKPGVICMCVDEPPRWQPAVDRIARERVLIVTVGQELNDPRVAAHVGTDLPAAAELLGDNLERIAAGRQSYLLVHAAGTGTLATRCYQRFMEKAHRQFDMKLLAEGSAADADGHGDRVLTDLLKRYPRVGLVITLDANLWLHPPAGWEHDVRGVSPDFRFATLSAAPVLWSRLGRPGGDGPAVALVGPLDGDIGYAAVEAATDALLRHRQGAPRIIPSELVTPETLADFARRYSEAASGLDVSAFLPRDPGAPGPTGG